MRFTKTLLATAVLASVPMMASAESQFTTGVTTPITASAKVDFTIVVPKIIYLRVGTGTNLANNVAVDLITFTVPAASIGNSTAVAGTGGDLTGGVVTARVVGNNGIVTLSSTTTGNLTTGVAAELIPYSQITTTPAVLTSATALPAPALASGATTSITLTPVNRVTNQDASWTYSYLNSAVVASGTYGGVNVNGGRVTYTASMP